MTPAQLAVERDALLVGGRTLEEVERMQRGATAGALLDDHRESLEESYFRLCAVLTWTWGSSREPRVRDIRRAVRHLCERMSMHIPDSEVRRIVTPLAPSEETRRRLAQRPEGGVELVDDDDTPDPRAHSPISMNSPRGRRTSRSGDWGCAPG